MGIVRSLEDLRIVTIRQRAVAAVAAAGILALPGSAQLGPNLAVSAVSAMVSATAGPQYEGESYYVDSLWPGTVITPAITTGTATGRLPGPYGLSAPAALTSSGIPAAAYRAYVNAAGQLAQSDPSCGIQWSVLAGIGRVESNHGRFGGSSIGPSGVVAPAIIGIRLDGTRKGTARIGDSDNGRYDRDPLFDRAVGPMQFLPGTWEQFAPGADPQDMNAAALAAGRYLCQGNASLATPTGRWAAVYRYNHSDSYVSLVLSLADSYASGTAGSFPSRPAGTPALPAQAPSATAPGPPPSLPVTPPVTPVPPSAGPVPPSTAPVPSGTASPSPTTGPVTTPPQPTVPPAPTMSAEPSEPSTPSPDPVSPAPITGSPDPGTVPSAPPASPATPGIPAAAATPPV